MKKYLRLFLIIVATCLLFTSCTSEEQRTAIGGNKVDSQTLQNLEKLCKVWGYTKYTHPVFLQGEKDWDEELLALIPKIKSEKADKVNSILHEWFISLGEIDYGTSRRGSTPIESEAIVQANTQWISDVAYLGEELSADLQQLGAIPGIVRSKGPVKFVPQIGKTDFSNEKIYVDMDYSDPNYRLLGLFRVWNAVEYYFPYLDIMDENWSNMLIQYIPQMLEGEDKQSFELTIANLTAHMQDAHVGFTDTRFYDNEFGKYLIPVSLIQAENKLLVDEVWKENCPLQKGDIILKLDGIDIQEIVRNRKQYISVTDDKKIITKMGLYLLRSSIPDMEVTIERNEEEKNIAIQGITLSSNTITNILTLKAYEVLQNNIGLINPAFLPLGDIETTVAQMMNHLQNTDGLIVDLRQYPFVPGISLYLPMYLQTKGEMFAILTQPSQSVPGTFVKQKQTSWGVVKASGNSLPTTFYYDKPVVLLMNEETVSEAEFSIMALRQGKNVTVIGSNSIGSDGNVSLLPLPNGNNLKFTGVGVYTSEMGQTQRIGLTPDIEVKRTIQGIKEGRDELKEAAIKYLTEQK